MRLHGAGDALRGAAAVLVVVAALAAPAPVRAEIVEEVAAFVNGQILTRSDLLEREDQVRAQLTRQFSGEELDARLAEARRDLLTDLIREILLLQRAEIMGLDLDKVYKSALDNLKEQQGIKTNDEMKALLKQEGMTEEELKRILLRYNVPDIMINLEVRQKIVVPEEAARAYFDKHRDEFRVEETYKVREVVLLTESHSEQEIEDLIGKIQADIAAGLLFAELVLKYSEAPSRFQEGVVGPIRANDFAPVLRDAAQNLAPGEVAGPLRLRHGVHFIQLEAKTEAKEPGFEEVRSGVENKLKQQMFGEELEAYWQRLYRENRIVVQERYRSYAEGVPRT